MQLVVGTLRLLARALMRDFLHGHGVQRDMSICGIIFMIKKGTIDNTLRTLFFLWMYRYLVYSSKNARTFDIVHPPTCNSTPLTGFYYLLSVIPTCLI